MKALAEFVMRGPTQAALVTLFAGLLAPYVPLLGVVSGGAVGLVTLARGRMAGWQVVWRAMLAVAAVGLLIPPHNPAGSLDLALSMLMVMWGPMLILGGSLRRTASLARALLLAGMLTLSAVVGLHLVVGSDPVAWWGAFLGQALEQMGQPPPTAEMEQGLAVAAPLLPGFFGLLLLLGVALMLFLARWWQGLLYNPGGFGREFRSVRLGRPVAGVLLALLLVAAVANGPAGILAENLLIAGALLPLVQGIAIVHGLVARTGAGSGWLIGMYLLLVLMPQTALLLALAGLLDNWFDFRAFFGAQDDV